MNMILTTTNGVEGRPVAAYLGLVASEAIMGANFFRDFFASVRDVFGGRSASYEKVFADARAAAEAELVAKARERGADAVIGIAVDHEVIGGDSRTILMVSMTGTAVRLG